MSIDNMTKKELVEYGESIGLSLNIRDKKEVLISKLKEKEGVGPSYDDLERAYEERLSGSSTSEKILIVIFIAVFIGVGFATGDLLYNLYPDDLGEANIFFIEESYPYGNVKNLQLWFIGSLSILVAIRAYWLVEKLIFKDSSKNYLHSYEEILIEKRLVWWYFFIGWFLWVFTPIAIYFLSYINPILYMWDDTIWNLSFFLNIGFTYLLVRHFMNMKKRLISEKNR